MSGKTIRIDLDAASEMNRTDWQRVRMLCDADIDAAISDDPDWLAFEGDDFRKASANEYIYQVIKVEDRWTWRLVAADGSVIAVGPADFATKRAVTDALRGLRAALIGGRLAA